MTAWTRFKRWLCPACIGDLEDIDDLDRRPDPPFITMLERSGEALDRILADMAHGPNPVLGDRPEERRK